MESLGKLNSARLILQRELARRCKFNTSYSLRAFARDLGLSHPLVSLILSGKRKLSKRSARLIAEKLPLSLEEKKFFLGDLDFINGESEYQKLELDTFALISDWYHYAILSLLNIKNAKFEATWIAKKLRISTSDAQEAMNRLIRLKLIQKRGKHWKQTGLPIEIENCISTVASRKFHRQILEKAVHSLENDPLEERDFSSMTLTIDASVLPHALQKIRAFRRYLATELEEMKPGDRVYNLTVQLYPVSYNETGEGKK